MALNITTIDFLSLDVEGAEKAILRTFPWDKIYIRSFVMENNVGSFDYELVKEMNEKGFLILSHGGNSDYFFVRQDDPIMKNVDFQPTQEFLDSGSKIHILNPGRTKKRDPKSFL
ncbi:unnamed protein product [Meganyctiphanes norvegica]|uniref:Methyltransferase FkbM domain-containing protein n=1 Tax=Meganyctiphanes norvegica TaxID=48144 RepID=A0AAV2QX53_MEGNR